MAPSDISLSRMAHHPYGPASAAAPLASPAMPASSAATTAAPSFTELFASIAAGTTVASTASPAGGPPIPVPAASVTSPSQAADGPAGPLFGVNPWAADPTGSGPGPTTHYNPIYFATPQTAQTVAQMVGGSVVSMNEITTSPGSPFQQNQPNLMVKLPNGGLINPGLVADIYTHGWNQAFVNQQVANEVAGAVPESTNS